jgi:hypothetical protein
VADPRSVPRCPSSCDLARPGHGRRDPGCPGHGRHGHGCPGHGRHGHGRHGHGCPGPDGRCVRPAGRHPAPPCPAPGVPSAPDRRRCSGHRAVPGVPRVHAPARSAPDRPHARRPCHDRARAAPRPPRGPESRSPSGCRRHARRPCHDRARAAPRPPRGPESRSPSGCRRGARHPEASRSPRPGWSARGRRRPGGRAGPPSQAPDRRIHARSGWPHAWGPRVDRRRTRPDRLRTARAACSSTAYRAGHRPPDARRPTPTAVGPTAVGPTAVGRTAVGRILRRPTPRSAGVLAAPRRSRDAHSRIPLARVESMSPVRRPRRDSCDARGSASCGTGHPGLHHGRPARRSGGRRQEAYARAWQRRDRSSGYADPAAWVCTARGGSLRGWRRKPASTSTA